MNYEDLYKFRVWDDKHLAISEPKYFYSEDGTLEDFWHHVEWHDGLIYNVEQSTGYRDKNGKLIYVGDIISYSGTDSKGHTVKDCTYFIERGGLQETFGMSAEKFFEMYTCEVIGNLNEDSIPVELDLGD